MPYTPYTHGRQTADSVARSRTNVQNVQPVQNFSTKEQPTRRFSLQHAQENANIDLFFEYFCRNCPILEKLENLKCLKRDILPKTYFTSSILQA